MEGKGKTDSISDIKSLYLNVHCVSMILVGKTHYEAYHSFCISLSVLHELDNTTE
jgi:hypothetical protein